MALTSLPSPLPPPRNLGGILWQTESTEYGRSDSRWLLRPAPTMPCPSTLAPRAAASWSPAATLRKPKFTYRERPCVCLPANSGAEIPANNELRPQTVEDTSHLSLTPWIPDPQNPRAWQDSNFYHWLLGRFVTQNSDRDAIVLIKIFDLMENL